MSNVTLNIDAQESATKKAALIQKIYEDKCTHPSFQDILNCLYECDGKFSSLIYDLASLIHQAWNTKDVELGVLLRERFKQDFLEVAEIEAFEALER